jgi:hypothetical protein
VREKPIEKFGWHIQPADRLRRREGIFFLICLSGLSYSYIPSISVSEPFIFCSCPFYVQLSVLNRKSLIQNDSVSVNLLSEDYRRLTLRRKSTKMASEQPYSFLIGIHGTSLIPCPLLLPYNVVFRQTDCPYDCVFPPLRT